MRCPRCKRKQNVLEYVPLMLIEEFENQTATIYKCPKCKWLFAPSVDLKDVLNGVYG